MKSKLLFVCWADYIHSQSWIDLMKGSDFDIRVFASPIDLSHRYPPLPWLYPTYSIYKPTIERLNSEIKWLFPSYKSLRLFLDPLAYKSRVPRIWLGRIIQNWRPNIIHSLSFNMGAYLTWEALRKIPKEAKPKWVISSWGTEIDVEMHVPETRLKLSRCIQECDGFIADCYRDIRNAITLGLTPSKLPGDQPIPGAGGIDLGVLAGVSQELKKRKWIIIPKAKETKTNKTLPILDALRMCEDVLDDYHIYFLITSDEIRSGVEELPSKIRERCTCMPHIPHHELMRMFGSARVMIAPSVSDGTPNVMLEAMALGALPIMSPIASIQEWIRDGENGLLVDALDPYQIAKALQKALTDDNLWERAAQANKNIVNERANRNLIRQDVIKFYQRIINPQVNEGYNNYL